MINKTGDTGTPTSADEIQNFLKQRLKEEIEEKTEIYKDWFVADCRISSLKIENKNLKEMIKNLEEQMLSYGKVKQDKDEIIKSLKDRMQSEIQERDKTIHELEGQVLQIQKQPNTWGEQAGRPIEPSPRERQLSLGSNSMDLNNGSQMGLDYSSTSLDTEFYCRGVAIEKRNRENKIVLTRNQTLQDLSKNIIVKGMLEQQKWDPKNDLPINKFLGDMQRKAIRMSINSITLAQITLSAISTQVMDSIASEVTTKKIVYYTESNPDMEFIGIQWAELVKILLNYYAEKTSFVASLLNAFQLQMNNREKTGQLFRVFHNRLRTQLQSALRKSALTPETQKEMVNFLTLVGLIRRLPPRIVNNYLRQNGTPTIDNLLEYCERSSVVAEEYEGMGGPRARGINVIQEQGAIKEDQEEYRRDATYSTVSDIVTENESTEQSSNESEFEVGDTDLEELEESGNIDINVINNYRKRREMKKTRKPLKDRNGQQKKTKEINNISNPRNQRQRDQTKTINRRTQPLSACPKCIVNGTKCQCPRCQFYNSYKHLAQSAEACQRLMEKNRQQRMESYKCFHCQKP